MAVDQQATAQTFARLIDERLQRPVIRPVEVVDTLGRFGETKLALVNILIARDDAGDGAEAGRNPRGVAIDVGWQGVLEHLRVELERLPVGVEI